MTRPRGAIASALRRMPDFQRLDSAALAGHARLFIHPAYARLVNSEPYVKRLIPILIVLFVTALGLMRVVALYQAHSEAQAGAELRLSLVAKAVVSELAQSRQPLPLTEPSETLQGQLENALPQSATDLGRQILVMDPQGMVVAETPREPNWIGRYIDEILGPSQPLTTLGEKAGVLTLTLASDEEVLATVHHNLDGVGAIAVLQPTSGALRRMAAHGLARSDGVRGDERGARHPRLRLSRADRPRARSGLHLFGDADARPHRAPPRPLGPLGMGSFARRDLLVAVDVRDFGARAREPPALCQRSG